MAPGRTAAVHALFHAKVRACCPLPSPPPFLLVKISLDTAPHSMKGHKAERTRETRKKAILAELEKMPALMKDKLRQYKVERARERALRAK